MNWETMETAPKDKRILLYYDPPLYTDVSVICGKWDDDKYAYKSRPHWTNDLHILSGANRTRNMQPVLWKEIEYPF
jgi:hypothetical protein